MNLVAESSAGLASPFFLIRPAYLAVTANASADARNWPLPLKF